MFFCVSVMVSFLAPFFFLQPHPNVKPMAYANTLMQLGMM